MYVRKFIRILYPVIFSIHGHVKGHGPAKILYGIIRRDTLDLCEQREEETVCSV